MPYYREASDSDRFHCLLGCVLHRKISVQEIDEIDIETARDRGLRPCENCARQYLDHTPVPATADGGATVTWK